MSHWAALVLVGSLLLLAGRPAAGVDKEALTIVKAKLAMGEAMLGRSEYASAEKLFRQAIAVEPMVPTAHLGLAAALVGLGRFEEALEVLAESEQRFIEWEQMISLAELQKRQLAERQLQSLKDLAAAENNASSQLSLVGAPRDLEQVSEDRITKEQFLFRERRELEGLHAIPAQVFYLEGIAHLRTGDPILGIEALEVCLLVDPDHGLAHYNLAVALFGQGEYAEAREHLDAALLAGVEPHPRFVEDLEKASG